jgi:uncharacterized protein (TIGR02594 family)
MNKDIITAFQQRLTDLGYYRGTVDGDAGTLTEKAVIDFKRNNGLNPRPYVGVLTLAAMFDDDAKRAAQIPITPNVGSELPHMLRAKQFLGLKETWGATHNKTIMGWAKKLGLENVYTNDEISWCGLFIGAVMQPDESTPLPKSLLSARAWLNYGREVTPGYGAILVFWRGSKSSWQGHVGFYVGEDANNYYVLGGNQSNSVNITKVSKSRLLGAVVPSSVSTPLRKVTMTTSGAVSTNEE